MRSRPLLFLSLVGALSIPLYALGAVTGGVGIGSMLLPSSALIFVLPGAVAVALTWREGGGAAVAALVRRVVDRPAARPRWYVLALLLIPVLAAGSHVLLWWTGRVDSPVPVAPTSAVAAGVVLFAVGAACEELGWTAYATDPLQQRFGPIAAALGLGLYWAVWHLVGWLQAGHPPGWVAGWFVVTVAARVIVVWLHNATGGGVTAAILLHTMLNVVSASVPELSEPIGTITLGIVLKVVAVGVMARSLAYEKNSASVAYRAARGG